MMAAILQQYYNSLCTRTAVARLVRKFARVVLLLSKITTSMIERFDGSRSTVAVEIVRTVLYSCICACSTVPQGVDSCNFTAVVVGLLHVTRGQKKETQPPATAIWH